jgi:antitoxin CcdA
MDARIEARGAGRRRSTNLTIDPVLVAEGKAAGLNLSKIAEDAIRVALRRKRREEWLTENEEAIAAYNRRVEERGMFNEGLRRF